MMTRKRITLKNYRKVFTRMADFVDTHKKDDGEYAKDFLNSANEWLDELCSDDFFGTESQNDPRGDQRD